jgi:flagellar biogenesis protein FliO
MLDSLFGGQLGTMAKFAIAFILVLGLIGITALILKRFGGGMPTSGGGRNRQPRLSVLDSAVVDSKRKLVLIRRDNSEHLLLIGGPTDVVVETNINRAGPVTSAGRSRAIPQQEIDALENALLAEPAYEEPALQPAPRTPQPAPRPREAAPRPQLRPQPQPEPIDDLPLAPPLRPEPQPEPAAFSPPPPLPPRPVAHPSAAAPVAPAPRAEPDYADMQAKMEAALRKPASAPTPRAPEQRTPPPAPRPAPPMPQTRPMPAAPAPAVSQPVAPKPSAQDTPNPFDSLEAEMASLLGQDKKR